MNPDGLNEIEGLIDNRTIKLESIITKVSIWVITTAIIIASVIFGIYKLQFSGSLHADQEVWGQFGDFFGGTLNPIFSLLSLIAILVTLIIQTRELSFSTETLKKQNSDFRVQSFETSFFTLLRMNNENVKSISLEDTEPSDFIGHRAIRKLYNRLEDSYKFEQNNSSVTEEELVCNSYNRFYKKNSRFIGHHLRILQQIIIFIVDRSPDEQAKYWEIICAQMSTHELLIVFYHSVTQSNYLDLKILLEMRFFEHLEHSELLDPELHTAFLKI